MLKLKEFIKKEISSLKDELSIVEYIAWWLLRLTMVIAIIYLKVTDPENVNIMLVSLNLLATFTVPLVRLLLFPKKLFTRLPFRTQTILNIMIFLGSFLGQGMGFIHSVTSWDKIMHFVSGAVILLIGNELTEMFRKNGEKLSPAIRTFCATGFSYAAIVFWEIFEFFADYYWENSSNQAYGISPERDAWFIKIFGYGAQNENQWAVFDTNVDMLCAVVGSIPAIILLYVYLRKKEKKTEN